MLKEVETNGQLALGKQFTGRRYDLQFHADGRIELLPISPAQNSSFESTREWVQQNAEVIEKYNTWAGQREPYAQRVRRWRTAQFD